MTRTPVTLTSRHARPRYPLVRVRFDREADITTALFAALESAGVHCDIIESAVEEVRADPARMAQWVTVV